MKRILSVLMICALLISGLAAIAMAEGVPSLDITVDDTAINVGDTVTAEIYLKDYVSLSWVTVTATVTYDADALEFSEVVNGALPGDAGIVPEVHNDAANGKVHICWIDLDGIPNDPAVPMALVKFTAKAEAPSVSVGTGFAEEGQVQKPEEGADPDADPIIPDFSDEEVEIDAPIVIRPEGTVDPSSVVIKSIVDPDNKASFDVKATFTEAGDVDKYKVNVSWESEGFIYTEKGTEWNPRDHKWEDTTPAGWAGTGSIKLENHSSKAVTACFAYAADGNDTAMEFKLADVVIDENGIIINAPAVTQEGEEVTAPGAATVTAGITAGTIEGNGKIGTITFTIS